MGQCQAYTWSSLSVGRNVSRASSVSLGDRSVTQARRSGERGPSTPPASRKTGTPDALASCREQVRKSWTNVKGPEEGEMGAVATLPTHHTLQPLMAATQPGTFATVGASAAISFDIPSQCKHQKGVAICSSLRHTAQLCKQPVRSRELLTLATSMFTDSGISLCRRIAPAEPTASLTPVKRTQNSPHSMRLTTWCMMCDGWCLHCVPWCWVCADAAGPSFKQSKGDLVCPER